MNVYTELNILIGIKDVLKYKIVMKKVAFFSNNGSVYQYLFPKTSLFKSFRSPKFGKVFRF